MDFFSVCIVVMLFIAFISGLVLTFINLEKIKNNDD